MMKIRQHEFFRIMFMMSPGIVLFFALFHLAFEWIGFIRVMIRKCLQGGNEYKEQHIQVIRLLLSI